MVIVGFFVVPGDVYLGYVSLGGVGVFVDINLPLLDRFWGGLFLLGLDALFTSVISRFDPTTALPSTNV